MRTKAVLSILLLFFLQAYADSTFKIEQASKLSNSQKYGPTYSKETVNISIKVTETTFSFNTAEGQDMSNFNIKKTTDKFIVAENSGNYLFYNKEEKQIHMIDFFLSRYSIYSYGRNYSKLKEDNFKMMDLLKAGKSQKDAIQYLIDQSSYDF